ncbi:uncharacterized protein LOC141727252 [Zonotrichia albicollis]|uniref:uncharacterized protein LOC141727252 n=1 Tax=Zonotrichia albicollis TaxID=44394 RepID=UPI003D80CD47
MVSAACPPHPSASAATPERVRQVSGGPRPWQRPERSSHSVPAPVRSEAGPAGSPGPGDSRGGAAAAAAIRPRSQPGPSPRFSRVTFRARAQPITRPGAGVTGRRDRAAAAILLGRNRAHGPAGVADWSAGAGAGGGRGGAPGQVWRAAAVGGRRGPIPWRRSRVGAPGGLKGSPGGGTAGRGFPSLGRGKRFPFPCWSPALIGGQSWDRSYRLEGAVKIQRKKLTMTPRESCVLYRVYAAQKKVPGRP